MMLILYCGLERDIGREDDILIFIPHHTYDNDAVNSVW